MWLRWYNQNGCISTTQENLEKGKQKIMEEKQRVDSAEVELARLKALIVEKGLSV